MQKITFKQYLESKKLLLEHSQQGVIFSTKHNLYKYCKIPLFNINKEKNYISFKPNDIIIIEWTANQNDIVVNNICIQQTIYTPFWNNFKIKSWVHQSTLQIL